MNCPNCKRPLATDEDNKTLPDDDKATHLCWKEWQQDWECQRIGSESIKSAMTTIEILQAAIDEGCDIEIETMSGGTVHVYFGSPTNCGWKEAETLETAIANAWQHYQTNKNQ